MSNLVRACDSVETREDLFKFIVKLAQDLKANSNEWENESLFSYLEAMSAWVNDMDGCFQMNENEMANIGPWKLLAHILYAAKMYE